VAEVVRLYYSVALLLPDGRVVTACGNPPPYGNQAPWEPPQPNEALRLEVYRAPYRSGSTAVSNSTCERATARPPLT
jgi:hypothetical protein